MDKQILLHKKFVQAEIARVKKISDEKSRRRAARNLRQFHVAQTRNFQHERLIHLLVTLFFAVLTIGAWIAFAAWFVISAGTSDGGDAANLATLALFLLALLLAILEVFYVRHYYRLENRTQNLYDLGREVCELTE